MIDLCCGDCLEAMRGLPDGCVDMVLCDPPYSLSFKSSIASKPYSFTDCVNNAYWVAEWLNIARKKLKPSGGLWAFTNFRSVVTYQKAADMINWPTDSMLVWDKKYPGAGGLRGLRRTYELVALYAMPDFKIEDRTIADIQCFPFATTKKYHPAEKPVPLLEFLVNITCPAGGVVLDPFMGSGSTGVACVNTGRGFIGIEMDEGYFAAAEQRIRAAEMEKEEHIDNERTGTTVLPETGDRDV